MPLLPCGLSGKSCSESCNKFKEYNLEIAKKIEKCYKKHKRKNQIERNIEAMLKERRIQV